MHVQVRVGGRAAKVPIAFFFPSNGIHAYTDVGRGIHMYEVICVDEFFFCTFFKNHIE